MGYETRCHTRVDDRKGTVRESADARVLLETDDLIVRGDARVKIPRSSIERIEVRTGVLTITSPTAVVRLTLGADAAARWQKKLAEPTKRLIDKLDVKPDARVWVVGAIDETLVTQLAERTTNLSRGRTAAHCDVVFVAVEHERDLPRIERALAATVDAGAIWVIHPKGAAGVADTTIFGSAKELGLTYTKVARVSATHTAEKLVRPLRTRGTTSHPRATAPSSRSPAP